MDERRGQMAIRLTTTNDSNGNPRRGWLIVTDLGDDWTHTVGWVEEGYEGRSALTRGRWAGVIEGPSFRVGPGEWREQRAHGMASETVTV